MTTSTTEERATTQETSAAQEPKAAKPQPKASKKAAAAPQKPAVAPGKGKAGKKATPAKNGPKAKRAAKAQKGAGPREGSKAEQVIAMLKRKNGATLAEIMATTGWLSHTTRAFVSATLGKKLGLDVESFKSDKGERTYRINQ